MVTVGGWPVSKRSKRKVIQGQRAPSGEREGKSRERPVKNPGDVPVEKPVGPSEAEDPLFGVALLRIALELKKQPDADLERVVTRVVAEMKLSEREFQAFLLRHGGLLNNLGPRRR